MLGTPPVQNLNCRTCWWHPFCVAPELWDVLVAPTLCDVSWTPVLLDVQVTLLLYDVLVAPVLEDALVTLLLIGVVVVPLHPLDGRLRPLRRRAPLVPVGHRISEWSCNLTATMQDFRLKGAFPPPLTA